MTNPSAIESFGALFAGPMESDEQWGATWAAALSLYAPEVDPSVRQAMLDKTTFRSAAWNNSGGLLAGYNVSEQLSNIDVPTLLLAGSDDFICGVPGHEELRDGIANSELVTFEGAGHFPFVTQQEQYNSAVQGWLKRTINP